MNLMVAMLMARLPASGLILVAGPGVWAKNAEKRSCLSAIEEGLPAGRPGVRAGRLKMTQDQISEILEGFVTSRAKVEARLRQSCAQANVLSPPPWPGDFVERFNWVNQQIETKPGAVVLFEEADGLEDLSWAVQLAKSHLVVACVSSIANGRAPLVRLSLMIGEAEARKVYAGYVLAAA